jgi:multiple sugar transport system substrate-binding protein
MEEHMKNSLKRFLALALMAVLLVSMVACANTSETTSTPSESGTASGGDTSTAPDPNKEYLDENGQYVPKVGVLDEYKGETFDILVVGVSGGTYQSDDFTTESGGNGGIDYGDTFYKEGVGARNDKIEEMYGVNLEVWKEDDAFSKAKNDATSGTGTYDAVILSVGQLASLAQDNLLWDYNSSEFEGYIDTKAPWWAQSASEAYSIGGKLYFMTGDITIMNKVNTWSILFNKEMVKNYGLDNPYDLYDAGTWTFDKMCEMARTVNTASPSVAWDDDTVIWGMVTATGDAYQFFGGSGLTVCEKENDLPVLSFGTEASITIAEKVLTAMTTSEWMLYATKATGGPTGNVWTDSFNVFNNGRALFRPSGFSAVTKASSWANIEFGIMPMPKMNESQEGYYTVTSGSWGVSILKNNCDHQFAAYMIDAFAAGAKNYVTPAYIEVNLKRKSLRDDDSERILEDIFDSIVYDAGAVYDFGGISTMFSNLVSQGSADIVSSFDSVRDQALNAIEDVIDAYAQDDE